MKLRHFSSKELKRVRNKSQGHYSQMSMYGKPMGLWVSDEDDYGWSEWCKSEGFMPGKLAYEHEVVLADNANILLITTPGKLLEFTNRFGHYPDGTKYAPSINWVSVAKEWKGMIVTPYIWSLRLERVTSWYYGWDCASGCIWDASAIKSIKLIKVHDEFLDIEDKSIGELSKTLMRNADILIIDEVSEG